MLLYPANKKLRPVEQHEPTAKRSWKKETASSSIMTDLCAWPGVTEYGSDGLSDPLPN